MSILKIEKLNTYYGKSHILQGVDFDLNKTGCLALLGRNGAGKSTTLRSIVNLTKPVSGKITFNNIDLEGLSTYEIAEIGLTMVPENRGMFSSLSVLESLNIINNNNKTWNIDRVLEAFPQLKTKLNNNSISLSGGEQQMLAIGKALMTNPKLILLDEPTQGLAPEATLEMTKLIQKLSEKYTILLIEHKMHIVMEISKVITVLNFGEVIDEGTPSEVKESKKVQDAYLGRG